MTNTLSTSKFVASLIGVSMVISFAFALPAKAATADELAAQIQSLLATIASLQAQLAGMSGGATTGGATGSACGVTFTSSHSVGDKGGQVMDVQKFLNGDAATTVATTGAGSAGNETSYFGPATKAAVSKFQAKYASEVLAPVGLTAPTGYWGPSSIAKANALNATCAPVTPGTPVVPGTAGVTVSAAAQPGNSLAVTNAANVPFTRFTVTAGAAPVTFDSVTVELAGLADKAAFSSVALLDANGNQVGLTKTLNSNDQANVGASTTVAAGTSQTYTVVGNMNSSLGSYAGQVAAFSVVAVNTASTVSGTLPITGAQHTINSSLTIGTATTARGVEDPNANQTKEIGTAGYTFQAVKITAGSAEDIRVKSVRWNQSGSASTGDIANVKVTFDGTEYTPTVDGDYYTANFGSGVVINKGLAKEMKITGDIINGSAGTIIFDIRKSTDLIVSGETYGYGITPSAGSTSSASDSSSQFTTGTPWYDGAAVTITGGSFNSVSKSNDAPAADVAEQVADTVLGAFTVDIKGESVTVETVKFGTQIAGGDDAADLTNVTLVDQNGTVLAGPEDGAADGFESTGDAAGEGSISFSSVTFPTGATTVFVKGQLGSDFSSTDTVVITTNPTDWTNATGDSTGDTVTLSNALATGNTMTVRAGALTATTLSQPAASNVVAGASDVLFATFSLDAANSGEDVKVTAVVVEDTISTDGEGTEVDNMELWADLTSADSARGDVYETRVADAEQLTGSGVGDHTISISLDQHITIAKNTSVEVAIIADLSSAASTSDEHTVSLDTDASDVTAVGVNTGATISVTPTGAGQTMTVAAGGTLTVSVDSSSPSLYNVLDDTSAEQTLAVFRLAANNVEDLDVDSMKLTDDGSADTVGTYKFYNGATLLGTKVGGATAEVFFNDGTLTVPQDGHVLVTVKGVMNNIDGTSVTNGSTVAVTIAAAGDVDTTGKDSGTAIDSTQTSVDAAAHNVYESVPVFANETLTNTTLAPSSEYLVAKFKVTANGSEDVTLHNADSNQIVVDVTYVRGDHDSAAVTVTLKDKDGDTLDSDATTIGAADLSGTESLTFDFSTADLTVAAGGDDYIYVYAVTTTFEDDNDSISASLNDSAASNLEYGIDGTGSFAEGDLVFKNDIIGQTHVNP